MTTISMMA